MPARLTFKLEAREAGEAVPFDAFAALTAHVASLLTELDVAASGQPSTRWVVRDLAAGSALIGVEGVPVNPLFDTSDRIARELASGFSIVALEHRRPESFSERAWEDTQAIVALLHDGISRLAVDTADVSVALTEEVTLPEGEAELLSEPFEIGEQDAISTIEGWLETVNLHGGQSAFAAWDVLYRRRVRCEFPPRLLDDVKRGLGERVRVHGRVTFDRFGRPLRIVDVTALEVLSATTTRPRPADLRGLVPNLTSGLDSADWVRRIRDA